MGAVRGVAAGFGAGAGALLLGCAGALTPAQVSRRVIATATPAPGGPRSTVYGYGIVNPYRLVTEGISGGRPDPLPALNPKTPTAAEQEQAQAWADSARLALWLPGAVAVLVVPVPPL